jgi:hypothetical protein
MARWILLGLQTIKPSFPLAHEAIQESLLRILKEFQLSLERVRFEGIEYGRWWIAFLSQAATFAMQHLGALNAARHLPAGGEAVGSYRDLAALDYQTALAHTEQYRYIICGHTHKPELVHLAPRRTVGIKPAFYINTGTWRRTHTMADGAEALAGDPTFACFDEECTLTIYDADEQSLGNPPFEFHRVARGKPN